MNKNEVPLYRQRKETIQLGKGIRKFAKVKKVLMTKLEQKQQEMMSLSQMLQQVEGGMQQMIQAVPKVPTIELDGQEEEVA